MSFRGGRGGGRGGRKNFGGRDREFEEGPPERVVGGCYPTRNNMQSLDMLCMKARVIFFASLPMRMLNHISVVISQIPYFNAPVYLENKTKIGKVDEILGAISDVHFSMKCDEGEVCRSVYQ